MSVRPPTGISVPVELVRCRDGDTIEVRLSGSIFIWAVRLIDCWCEESGTARGDEATRIIEKELKNAESLKLYVPFRETANFLKNFSFDRVLGHIYVSERKTISEIMVSYGLASKTKPVGGAKS